MTVEHQSCSGSSVGRPEQTEENGADDERHLFGRSEGEEVRK